MRDEPPKCPKCKSNANVERVKCKCAYCPPWQCMACDPDGYEFFDDDDDA